MADDTLHDAALLYQRALTSRGAAGERLARLAEEAAVRALDRELLGAEEHRAASVRCAAIPSTAARRRRRPARRTVTRAARAG